MWNIRRLFRLFEIRSCRMRASPPVRNSHYREFTDFWTRIELVARRARWPRLVNDINHVREIQLNLGG